MKNNFPFYIFCFFCSCLIALAIFLYKPHQDHIGAISLNGNNNWYMNFRRANLMQFQDRDIFYHHVGKSIEYAKQADIIILGHSMALFGIDWHLIEEFSKKHHIKIYNLSSASDSSGEFELRIIEKYHLHPKIWIINADDHENSFFKKFLQNNAKGAAADVVNYSRWQAYKNIISKNINWRLELFLRDILPEKIVNIFYPQQAIFNYRSIIHGNWNNDYWPGYKAKNSTFINTREMNCHTTHEELIWANNYVRRLQQGDVILTVIPHTQSCRPRVKEIAHYLHTPFISIDWHNMTSFDNGGHLDEAGAKKFTAELLHQLEKTESFKKLAAQSSKSKINRIHR